MKIKIICFMLLFYSIYAKIQTTGFKECSNYKTINENICNKHGNSQGYLLESMHGCLLNKPETFNNVLFYNNCHKKKCFDDDFKNNYNTSNYNFLSNDACIGARIYNGKICGRDICNSNNDCNNGYSCQYCYDNKFKKTCIGI